MPRKTYNPQAGRRRPPEPNPEFARSLEAEMWRHIAARKDDPAKDTR